jgi:hypothetical protein
MVSHICNPSTREAEAGGAQIQGQLGLCSKTLFLKNKGKKKRNYRLGTVAHVCNPYSVTSDQED